MSYETRPVQTAINFHSLCFIALPRTGTNYLCSLINRFQEIDSFYEIFHRQNVYIGGSEQAKAISKEMIKEINNKHNLSISDNGDSSFVDFVHQHPQYLLDFIRSRSDNKYISFKIFPDHLEDRELKSFIIDNKAIKKVIIKRNLLDTYISCRFAQKLQAWTKADTSRLYIDFDEKNFIKWYQRQEEFYDFVEKEMHATGQKVIIVEYEDLHKLGSDREKFSFVYDILKQLDLEISQDNVSNLDQKFPSKNAKILKKQDQRSSSLEKVSNPEDLQATLKKLGLEHLIH